VSGSSGKYRLENRLGGGGMAEVFLGTTVGIEGFSRRVAIKRVLAGFSENPAFAQMFVSEAQLSSQLVHPNIVSVLDFDRDPEGRLFLVMELVEGRDLDAAMATGLLPVSVVIHVIGEVLRGLGYAHDLPVGSEVRGVVHRDVSPHNVLLSWEGAVKVSDFGIAKARAASSATASVFIKGKPAYMSPEQANSERLDGRSDLFAVGIMLWEMLVGRRLFVGEDTRGTLAAVLFGHIPRPRSLRADVPKDVERVAMKLLERDLPARYASAEQALHDLLECADAHKAGRELLVKALAERFPETAPVRQSVVRTREAETRPDGIAGRVAPDASIGAMRAAATATIDRDRTAFGGAARRALVPARDRDRTAFGGAARRALVPARDRDRAAAATVPGSRGRRAASAKVVALAATAAIGVVIGAVALIGLHSDGSSSASRPIVADAEQARAAAPPPDAAAIALVAPPDAGGADAAQSVTKKDASSIAQVHSGPRAGKLTVLAFPVLTVIVDRKPYGETPLTLALPAGKHVVRLTNSETGHDETVPVTIAEDKTFTLDRRR
jgi:serine/threonine-protein kinase